jgi:hypothetical protein
MRRLLPLLTLVLVLGSVAGAGASTRQIQLGLHGDTARFAAVTGQKTAVVHSFVNFRQGRALATLVSRLGPAPMLALIPGAYGQAVTATPEGIAKGKNDVFLFQLNAAIDSFSGSWTKKAFARVAIIARGGTAADIDAKLARLHLPGIDRDLPVTTPKLQLVWNPQGFGSPDVPGNSANAYYPGNAYVDVVADDLYDIAGHGATWAAAEKLYSSHPTKAFGFGEWGLWGIDDPSFVRAMGAFARKHRRLVLLAYFSGKPGSVWDLHSKPRSAAAYRKYISSLG